MTVVVAALLSAIAILLAAIWDTIVASTPSSTISRNTTRAAIVIVSVGTIVLCGILFVSVRQAP